MIPISVIIPTKNRYQDLSRCLLSLQNGTSKPFEIIVLDQSDPNQEFIRIHNDARETKVIYRETHTTGKARALNLGISIATGGILAFTDDDCIVHKEWIRTIGSTMSENVRLSAVFGRTLAYQPHRHTGQICPCTFQKSPQRMNTSPTFHGTHIGFGNNMAIRRSVFSDVGLFNTWLGPGSIGSNAEDADMAIRILLHKKKILYNDQMRVYHNKWLTPEEMVKQSYSYDCGELACYGKYALRGHYFARVVVKNNIQRSITHIGVLHSNRNRARLFVREIVHVIKQICYKSRGMGVSLLLFLFYPSSK